MGISKTLSVSPINYNDTGRNRELKTIDNCQNFKFQNIISAICSVNYRNQVNTAVLFLR